MIKDVSLWVHPFACASIYSMPSFLQTLCYPLMGLVYGSYLKTCVIDPWFAIFFPAMKESEFIKLRGEIDRRYKSDLYALDRVWRLSNRTSPPKPGVENVKKGTVSKVVKAVVSSMDGNFTISDVFEAAAKIDPAMAKKANAIRTAFKRLLQNEVKTVSPKAGRKQAQYARVKQESSDLLTDELNALAGEGLNGETKLEEVPF